MSNRILLISPFFSPEPISTAKYNTGLVNSLVAKGCNVSVICLHPFYPEWQISPSSEVIEGVDIIRGGSRLKFTSNSFIRRVVLEIGFSIHVTASFLRRRKQFDQVIGILPPSLFFYLLLWLIPKKVYKTAIVHDLQSVYAKQTGSAIGKMIGRFSSLLESSIIKSMDKVIYLSNSMKRRAEEEFKSGGEKSIVAYPFVNIELWEGKDSSLEELFPNDMKHIIYSGAFSEKQNPGKLLQFFDELTAKRREFCCHIFSSGPLYSKNKEENKNSKIKFSDLVAEKDLAELYARSTVQIIPQLEGSAEASLPSKLPNLLKSGCPIFVVTDKGSEIGAIVRQFYATGVQYSWKLDDLIRTFLEFVDEHKNVSKKEIHKKRENNKLLDQFDLNTLCDQILSK